MNDHDGTTPLPGLDEPSRPPGALEAATRRTLADLQAAELLTERHAGLMELAITLGRQIDRAANSAKAKDYAVANLAGQYRDTILALPTEDGGGDDDLDALIADFMQAGTRDAT